VVWRADSGSAARRAGVLPGWTVEQIDDLTVSLLGPADSVGPRRLALLTGAMRALRGVPGTTVHVVARDPAGMRRTYDVTLDSMRGPFSKFGNLPPLPTTFEMTRRTLADGRCAAVIHFEYWMPAIMPALDRAVDAARGCGGIILDLRGNLGGVAGMMMGAAGHFLNEPRTLGIMRSRGEEMRFVANPRRATDSGVPVEPFAGDSVEENVGTVARLYYSGSTAVCVPHSRSEDVGLALGAQAGPARLSAVSREAGFSSVRVAHETPFNIVLEVRR